MKNLKHSIKLFICTIALALVSCSPSEFNINDRTPPQVMSTEPASIKPTSSDPVAKNLKPAGFKQTIVLQGLERPWGMAWLPDGALLITERGGRMQLLRKGVLERVEIGTIPELFVAGQAGLMDISLHPRYSENNFVYLTYSKGKVLVIDDDPTFQDLTLDVMMPQQDGWSVLMQLKSDPDLARIPVLMLTMVDNKEMGYALGAADCFMKPLNLKQISSAVRKYCPPHRQVDWLE